MKNPTGVIVALVLLLGFPLVYFAACWNAEPPTIEKPTLEDSASAYEVWWKEHAKACEQCAKCRRDPSESMCEEAFEKFRAMMRNPSPATVVDSVPPSPPLPDETKTPEKPATASCEGGQCQARSQPRTYQQPRARAWRPLQRLFNR